MEVLKTELIKILKELAPKCKNSSWIKNELEKLKYRETTDDFKVVADIAELFFCRISRSNPKLFTKNNPDTELLKVFIQLCHEQIGVVPFNAKKESVDNMIERVIREEK